MFTLLTESNCSTEWTQTSMVTKSRLLSRKDLTDISGFEHLAPRAWVTTIPLCYRAVHNIRYHEKPIFEFWFGPSYRKGGEEWGGDESGLGKIQTIWRVAWYIHSYNVSNVKIKYTMPQKQRLAFKLMGKTAKYFVSFDIALKNIYTATYKQGLQSSAHGNTIVWGFLSE